MKVIPGSKILHHFTIAGIFLITGALITGIPVSYGVGGDDIPSSQDLEIRTWYDLDAIRDNLDGNHILMNDLDSTTAGYEDLAGPAANQGKGWEPIGSIWSPTPSIGCAQLVGASTPEEWPTFTGSLNGQGYEICALFIDRPDESFVGLFHSVLDRIENIGMVNVTVTGKNYVGSLTGQNRGIVSNSYCAGNVTGTSNVGGLAGSNWGAISDAYSATNVTGYAHIGGLVGDNYNEYEGTVSNSCSIGSVTGEYGVGGLVGWNYYAEVLDSYSTGNVTGTENVGGLVGESHGGDVSNSYSTGNVTGTSHVGGLVGWNYEGSVSNSFWNMETSGRDTSDGGTGKNTTEMQYIATFSVAGWDIISVVLNQTNPTYIWNIVNNVTYPFLSWQS